MYQSPVPLLVIRTGVTALVTVNGRMLGECPADGFVTLPVDETGAYYMSVFPLSGDTVITRKLCFAGGALAGDAPELSVCVWPGGVYECRFESPRAPAESGPRILQSESCGGYTLTLYRENGLKLGVEREERPLYTYALGEAETGSLRRTGEYMAALISTAGRERLILLSADMQPVLDVEGDAVEPDVPATVERLNTRLGHERRIAYARTEAGFAPLPAQIGFFTHPMQPPEDEYGVAVAFFEAVREGFMAEAVGYLDPALQAEFSFADVAAFLGPFDEVRPPFSDGSGRVMGLVAGPPERQEARLYTLEFAAGRIANITEA